MYIIRFMVDKMLHTVFYSLVHSCIYYSFGNWEMHCFENDFLVCYNVELTDCC